jgi:hypothetical protein
MPRPNLNSQCERVWRSLRRAKPRSRRRIELELELIKIQQKRLKQDIKAGRAK